MVSALLIKAVCCNSPGVGFHYSGAVYTRGVDSLQCSRLKKYGKQGKYRKIWQYSSKSLILKALKSFIAYISLHFDIKSPTYRQ